MGRFVEFDVDPESIVEGRHPDCKGVCSLLAGDVLGVNGHRIGRAWSEGVVGSKLDLSSFHDMIARYRRLNLQFC